MSAYKDHHMSMIRYIKGISTAVGVKLNRPAPTYVNFDAHAQISEIPKGDVVGMMGFATSTSGKLLTVHLSVVVSTMEDPDLVRHVEMVDQVFEQFAPKKVIDIFNVEKPNNPPYGWLTVTDDVYVEPVGRESNRAIQVLTCRLLSGQVLGG